MKPQDFHTTPQSPFVPLIITGAFACLLLAPGVFAAAPTFSSFDTNGFAISGNTAPWTIHNQDTYAWQNIRWFGADPTATADSRNAIQAAINAAGPYGTVLIPPGNYKIVTSKPIIGAVARITGGGKLWLSLPDDYVKTSVYGIDDKYIATHVLNSSGAYQSWDSSSIENPDLGYYGLYPWNGKSCTFQGLGNIYSSLLIDGIQIDGGWGTTNAPGTVIPITGVMASNNETQWYSCFANCGLITFRNMRFSNMPGAIITHNFQPELVEGCEFGEYGDHIYYNTQKKSIRFVGNSIHLSRAAVGVEGAANFVPQTWRDAIKLRDCQDVTIADNTFADDNPVPLALFGTLESTPSVGLGVYTNDCRDIAISGNTIRTYGGWVLSSLRAVPPATDHGGLRLRNVRITGNTFKLTGAVVRGEWAAMDGFSIAGNTIDMGGSGAIALLHGNNLYNQGIRNFEIKNNLVLSTNLLGSPIRVAGSVGDILIEDNTFIDARAEHSIALNLMASKSDLSDEHNRYFTKIDRIDFKRNHLVNYMSLFADGTYSLWDAGTNYVFGANTYDDGYFAISQAVVDPTTGTVYTNKATVLSATEPHADAANWGALITPTTTLTMIDNDRYSDSTLTGGKGAQYLSYSPNSAFKSIYDLVETRNLHRTSIAQPIDHLFYLGVGLGTAANQVNNVVTNLYDQENKLDVWNIARVHGDLEVVGDTRLDRLTVTNNTYIGGTAVVTNALKVYGTGTTLTLQPDPGTGDPSLITWKDSISGSARGSIGFNDSGPMSLDVNGGGLDIGLPAAWLTLTNASALTETFAVSPTSGYSGTGTNDLTDDGTYKERGLIKIDAADTGPGYTAHKLLPGTNVQFATNNIGGVETLTITANGGGDITGTNIYEWTAPLIATLATNISIQANGIDNTLLRQGAARTVIGRSANSSGNVADIAGAGIGTVLSDNGVTLAFRSILNPTAGIVPVMGGVGALVDSPFKVSGNDVSSPGKITATNGFASDPPAGASSAVWKLGNYSSPYVRVDVGGSPYSLLTSAVAVTNYFVAAGANTTVTTNVSGTNVTYTVASGIPGTMISQATNDAGRIAVSSDATGTNFVTTNNIAFDLLRVNTIEIGGTNITDLLNPQAVTNYHLASGTGITIVTNVSGTNVTWTPTVTASGAVSADLANWYSAVGAANFVPGASYDPVNFGGGNPYEITLPAAGTYLVTAVVSWSINQVTASGWHLNLKLVCSEGGNVVGTDQQFGPADSAAGANFTSAFNEPPITIRAKVVVTGAATVTVYAQWTPSGGGVSTGQINYQPSTLDYLKL